MSDEGLDLDLYNALAPLEREWLLLGGMRQLISIAQRTQARYADGLSLLLELAPELIRSDSPFLDAFESNLERLYKARSAAQTILKAREVSSIELIDNDIQAVRTEVRKAPSDRVSDLQNWLNRLQRARQELATEKYTESQAIRRDIETLGQGVRLPISDVGKDYREYRFTPDRTLRVRVLHPDPAEWTSGVDLIYETYWKKFSPPLLKGRKARKRRILMVRVAALQYKMWNGEIIYLSADKRLQDQMDRARNAFCSAGLCNKARRIRRYGLPYCSVFLRPTDLRQTRHGFSATKGWHIPMCEAQRELFRDKESPRIESRYVASSSLSQMSFAELFNKNMMGSRWMLTNRLQHAYLSAGILSTSDNVVIHAQEY